MSNANRHPLPSQVSATARFFTAVGVCAALACVWIAAEHESHQAVQTATAAISNGPAQPARAVVEVAGRRVASARRS